MIIPAGFRISVSPGGIQCRYCGKPCGRAHSRIIDIGIWVLEESCRKLSALSQQGYTGLRMAVNISMPQFRDPNFIASVKGIITKFGVEPNRIELEITESVVMDEPQIVIEALQELKLFGVKVAIDDFGTGYSSLTYLKKMPVDVIKIDKSFVFGMLENRADYQIIMSTIAMVKNLGLMVIAEGVETSAQLRSLTENDCDVIQGYYFSKPIPEVQLMEFIDAKVVNGYWKTSAL